MIYLELFLEYLRGRIKTPESVERIPQLTQNVLIIWSGVRIPPVELLSRETGITIKEEDIVPYGGSYHPGADDPVKIYPEIVEKAIEDSGVPRAIIAIDVTASDVSRWQGAVTNFELAPQRTIREIRDALTVTAAKYNAQLMFLSREKLIRDWEDWRTEMKE